MKFIKILFSSFPISILLLFSCSQVTFAADVTAKVNPIYYSNLTPPIYGGATGENDINAVTNNDTSVTIRIEGLEKNWCYLFGKGIYGIKTGNTGEAWKEITTSSDPLVIGDTDGRNTDDKKLHFYQGDNTEGGWSKNLYAAQAGGTLCGFRGKPDGSGPDSPANYIRADNDGVIWLYDMCENFEGIRSDCNAKFVLAKIYNFTIFHVTCFIQTEGTNLDRGDHHPDPDCDLDKARIKDGQPTLRIWGADKKDGFPEKLLNYNFKDIKGGETADGFKKVNCIGCSFSVYTAKSKASGRFDINSNTVQTEFGPIPRDPVELATVVLRIALGVAGGLAFLLMVYGSLRLIFANGSPDAVQQGREIITAAIIGLLVIVFSTFILQLIGISILGLTT